MITSRRRFLSTGVLLPASAYLCFQFATAFSGFGASQSSAAPLNNKRLPLADDCGVASGAPTPQSVIIWTRLSSAVAAQVTGTQSVSYEMATSADFEVSSMVASGLTTTSALLDFTVRVTVENLQPNTRYFYRFLTENGYRSVVGRTSTLPSANALPGTLKFATISCQNYESG